MSKSLRTYVYVDGFNVYYRAIRNTPHKWLNLVRLCRQTLNPENTIERLRYFTADVSGRRDIEAPHRQQAYLRALKTLPEVSIHKGNFLSSTKWAEIANPPPNFVRPNPVTVSVVKTEEKGSDVNLASHLLNDAFNDRFDVGAVLSNDTDLVEPIRMVKEELGKPVGIICPCSSAARSLKNAASFVRHISPSRLAASQFANSIPGTTIKKPPSW